MADGERKLVGNGKIRDVYVVEYRGEELVMKVVRKDYELRGPMKRVENMHRWEAVALTAVKGHPNIAGLRGLCNLTSVQDYFPIQAIDIILKRRADRLPMSKILPMSLDIARGLQALHEVPGGAIVHYDLKPDQLVLDETGSLKLNDLNTCRFTDADAEGNTCPFKSGASRPAPWRSPENIAGELLSEKVDVYSMAMICYAMLAGKAPYAGEPNIREMKLNGIPPTVDPSWDPDFVEILQDMWQRDPTARPSARQIVARLEPLIETLTT